MDPMLTPPRRRPRPPSWRLPLLVAVAIAFLLALWAVTPASSALSLGGESLPEAVGR